MRSRLGLRRIEQRVDGVERAVVMKEGDRSAFRADENRALLTNPLCRGDLDEPGGRGV
jgi:hypothetical protein